MLPPDEILIHPCEAVAAGTKVETLSKGYVKNTSCVYKYKDVVDGVVEWKKGKQELLND